MPFRMPILQTRRRQCISLLLLLSGVTALAGCASYQVGQASLYRTDIQTVYVPMFESNTLRRHLGPWVTEAVIKRIESDTPYKVVHTATADSILTGRLLNVEKEVLSEDPFDEARDIGTSFVLHITWYARNGEILMQSRINASSHFIPESGQSGTSSQQEAIERLAETVVGRMETAAW